MKIAYITPYVGEEMIVRELLPEHEVVFVTEPLCFAVPEAVRDAAVLSVFVDSKVTAEMIDSMPNLQVIALRSTGYDHVAVGHAEAKGIRVGYVPHYGSQTVAEHAFALMLEISRKAYPMYQLLRTEGSLTVTGHEGFDLCGKTLGVIGTGAIGRRVCEIARGFRMNIIAFDLYPNHEFATELGFMYTSLEEVLATSDIVTLHVPSTPESFHLLNDTTLAAAKPGLIVINTARGTLIDTVALIKALKSGQLSGAGLDVYEGEEYIKDEMKLVTGEITDLAVWRIFAAEHELLDMPNVIMTPHMAFNTKEAKREITETTVANIKAGLVGEPVYKVKLN